MKTHCGAVIATAIVVTACGSGEDTQTSTVQTSAVTSGVLRITAEATGTVEPIRKVEVKSKASGEILALAVDVGDQVATGALLARIDPRDVRNSFEQAQADLEVAQARLEISEARAQRSTELLEAGVITAQEYESSRLDLATAQANLVKANTNLELAELRLGDVTITAPLEGTILQKSVEEGQVIQSASQNVSGGTTLFVMANLLDMQARTLVDETDMGQIRAGMPATVRVEAFPEQIFQGTVEKIEPQAVVQQSVTMFPVIVRLDNREGMLRPGMNAEVEILIDQAEDILLVPNNAIVLPQDVGPAALVLSLDVESLDLATLAGRGMRAGAAAPGPGSVTATTPPDAARGARRQERAEPAETGPGTDLESLRAHVQSGELSQDSVRALMLAMRGGASGEAGGDRERFARGPGGQLQQRGASAGGEVVSRARAAPRRAVVFVVDDRGVPEPRGVQIGLNDWDRTEIVSGVAEGERVALLGAAQLQAQQQEFLNRVRQGAGGPFGGGRVFIGRGPGSGGGGGRGP